MGPCCCAWCAEQEDRASRSGNSSAPSVPTDTLIHSIPGGLAVISTEKIVKEYLKLKDLTDNLLYLLTQTRSSYHTCFLVNYAVPLHAYLKLQFDAFQKAFQRRARMGELSEGFEICAICVLSWIQVYFTTPTTPAPTVQCVQ